MGGGDGRKPPPCPPPPPESKCTSKSPSGPAGAVGQGEGGILLSGSSCSDPKALARGLAEGERGGRTAKKASMKLVWRSALGARRGGRRETIFWGLRKDDGVPRGRIPFPQLHPNTFMVQNSSPDLRLSPLPSSTPQTTWGDPSFLGGAEGCATRSTVQRAGGEIKMRGPPPNSNVDPAS